MSRFRSPIPALDQVIYIKRGYSIFRHLVPFSVAALLLVVTSLPKDNLLLKLIEVLKEPWTWLPAGLLTLVACIVYVAFIHAQVRQAYLWASGIWRRALITSLIFMLLCSVMTYWVLWLLNVRPLSWNTVWACFLLSTLSLTGIGWTIPDTWIESLGIKAPDYSQALSFANELIELVEIVSNEPYGEKGDIKDFLEVARNMRKEIQSNIKLEPEWARPNIDKVNDHIRLLIEQTELLFPLDDEIMVSLFPAACNDQLDSLYAGFVVALKTLRSDCLAWRSSKRSLK